MSLVTFLQLRNSLPTSPMSSSAIQIVSCYVPQQAVVGQSWSTLDNFMAVQILRWRLRPDCSSVSAESLYPSTLLETAGDAYID